ncbi:flagellar export chaperone FliS [bacterium]|nr:flagellar export chaperone FliS [bacterium]
MPTNETSASRPTRTDFEETCAQEFVLPARTSVTERESTMQMTSTRAYLESTVMTARPEQLQMMLYEGAIRFTQGLRAGIVEKDAEKVFVHYEKTSAILNELHNSLRPKAEPELCEKYSALYDFCQKRLDNACLKHELTDADAALSILQHLRQTWMMVIDKIRDQRVDQVPVTISQDEYVPLAVDA